MFFFQYKLLFNCVVWDLLFFRGTDLRGIVLNISFFDATEEGGTFSFYRKIYKLAPMVISLPSFIRLVPNSFTDVPIFSAYLKSISVIRVMPSV